MFKINAHATPTEESSEFGTAKGAYAVAYINFADIDGAYELAKYYIKDNGWVIDDLEDEYYILKSIEDVKEDDHQYYNEALNNGYSLIFHCYENSEDELEKDI